jgi:hypothetical protein
VTRPFVFGVPVLFGAALACGTAYSGDDEPVFMPDPADASAKDVVSTDAQPEAAVEASTGGDPTLDRAPITTCYTPIGAPQVPAAFPGYAYDFFQGARTGGGALTNLVGEGFYCPSSGLLKLQLGYDAPAASSRPSLGILREGVSTTFTLDYVIESAATPSETQDDVLVGPFLRASSAGGLLVVAVAKRAPSEELEVVRVNQSDTLSASLGVLAYPVRVRLQSAPDVPGKVRWTVTATDRARSVVQTGVDAIPTDVWGVLFGVTRTAPGAVTSATYSAIKLP